MKTISSTIYNYITIRGGVINIAVAPGPQAVECPLKINYGTLLEPTRGIAAYFSLFELGPLQSSYATDRSSVILQCITSLHLRLSCVARAEANSNVKGNRNPWLWGLSSGSVNSNSFNLMSFQSFWHLWGVLYTGYSSVTLNVGDQQPSTLGTSICNAIGPTFTRARATDTANGNAF